MFGKDDITTKYRRKNSLIRTKYLEYVPVLLVTNIASLLLITIDGIFVGNYIGSIALAAVDMFTPIEVLLSSYIALIAHGIADNFADALVSGDSMKKIYIAKAIKFVIFLSIIVLLIIQVPIAYTILKSYNSTPELYSMAKAYTVAMLISMPFQLISNIGACQFQEIGKVNVLMHIAITEGIINIILNLILVVGLNMGVYGAGIATAIAVIVDATLTMIYLLTKTSIYKFHRGKLRIADVKKIIITGIPYSISVLTSAVHAYLMLKIIFLAYGESGAIVDGVCQFCLSIATVFITSCGDANGPLNGIFLSIGDRVAVRDALKISIRQIIVSVGIFTLIIFLKPELFYRVNGVTDIPNFGLSALKIYSLCFVFWGINSLFAGFFIDINKPNTTEKLTLIGDLLTPALALTMVKLIGKIYLWFAEIIIASIVLISYLIRFAIAYFTKEIKEEKEGDILYLEVKPDEALEASKELLEYAKEHNYPKEVSHNVALCMEDFVNYAVKSRDSLDIHIQIMIRFHKNGAKFIMLDDGERLHLNEYKNPDETTINNYELVKHLAKSYKYQYVLNMNYVTFEF